MLSKEKQLMLDLLIEKYQSDSIKIDATNTSSHKTMALGDFVKSVNKQLPRKKREYLGGQQWTVAELMSLNELCAEVRTPTITMARQLRRTVSSVASMIGVINRGVRITPTMREYLQTQNFHNVYKRSEYWRRLKNLKHS
jgi:hypothetical protein